MLGNLGLKDPLGIVVPLETPIDPGSKKHSKHHPAMPRAWLHVMSSQVQGGKLPPVFAIISYHIWISMHIRSQIM